MTDRGAAVANQEKGPHEAPSTAQSEACSSQGLASSAAQRKPPAPKGDSTNHIQNGPAAKDARRGQHTLL